jgi:allophanate hydrolase
MLAAHRAGASVRATIAAAYAAIRVWNDPALFISLKDENDVLAEADALDRRGDRSLPLLGIPFAVKDNIDVAGLPTTAACPAFSYRPSRSAFVVEALVAAGAIATGSPMV